MKASSQCPSFKVCTVTVPITCLLTLLLGLMTISRPTMVSAASMGQKMIPKHLSSSAPAAVPSINRADAIKRFKAADTNGDCAISDSELQVYAISHIIDPTFEAIGYSIDNESQLQDIIKEAYHQIHKNMSMNGTKRVGPADFVQNMGSWTCSPKVPGRSRSLVGRSQGATCHNVCTHNLHCCNGSCQSSSCPGGAACIAAVDIVTLGVAKPACGQGFDFA